jgi:hypothetical protein
MGVFVRRTERRYEWAKEHSNPGTRSESESERSESERSEVEALPAK